MNHEAGMCVLPSNAVLSLSKRASESWRREGGCSGALGASGLGVEEVGVEEVVEEEVSERDGACIIAGMMLQPEVISTKQSQHSFHIIANHQSCIAQRLRRKSRRIAGDFLKF